jgi:hypothetical protein
MKTKEVLVTMQIVVLGFILAYFVLYMNRILPPECRSRHYPHCRLFIEGTIIEDEDDKDIVPVPSTPRKSI